MAKRKFVNNTTRSRMVFSAQRLMKGMKAKEVEEITKQNGHRGVHRNTIKRMYLKPQDGGTMWPTLRVIETICGVLGAEVRMVRKDGTEI